MKIIILGAGRVGGSLARILADEANDITLVDEDAKQLRIYHDQTDLKIITGSPSHPDVLHQADAENADMLVALTPNDETNMVACRVAHTLFHVPTKIARIHSNSYLENPALFEKDAVPVDVLISPEQLVAQNVQRLIKYPGALQVVEFVNGRLLMVATKVDRNGYLTNKKVRDIPAALPDMDMQISALYRNNRMIIPTGTTELQSGDEVFFLAAEEHVRAITAALHNIEKPYSRILIAGGGRTGMCLAQRLIGDYTVKIIERNKQRARHLAECLDDVIVLHGDASNEEILLEENVDWTDVFCALTSDDEDNILSAMLAKHLGARKVMSLISRPSYVDLIQSDSIDIAISPQQDSLGALLRHIRKGDVVTVHSLRRGAAEAIEGVVHGDAKTSRLVGRKLDRIRMPHNVTIGAVVRGDNIYMAHHDIVVEPDDHIILFLNNKRRIPEVEKLFQVSATFF